MRNFGIIGVGGYIAPRHLKAIKETKNNLSAALDISDSVGVIDQFFPGALFFLDSNKFEQFIGSGSNKVEYISICTPNNLHHSQIKMALENGCDAICEKPVVLSLKELDELSSLEKETGKRVYTILQLRKHAMLAEFKLKLDNEKNRSKKEVVLTYVTGRGQWYYESWKGDLNKSGGIATNIGIHLFDLLIWLFGNVNKCEVHLSAQNKIAGYLELENANVKWFLSIDFNDIPEQIRKKQSTYRSIRIDNAELEFSDGFADLHTIIYKDILEGNGIGIETARPSIMLVNDISNNKIEADSGNIHPVAKKLISR